ncbi:CaiB/BaiF CoA transferase family protein [Phenylobacterium soli]|uniref:CoA transferase n=1 Tax=Phenylobacterium soli TaxID=2170551 RepID=A0A328AAQ6_9CAUL|nr:CoA transferase [Phenylobacterium soli]RAK51772.1 CoA transferase [Phenylobacterium soli]
MGGPLAGLRVVDFSKFLPGPYCTWMLGDLGAEVIRLENPRELKKQAAVFGWDKLGDAARRRMRAQDLFARNKKTVVIDPGHAAARPVIEALVKSADILVEDYRPGVMEKMGLGYAAMAAINPRLVYCSVTLCGQTGPYRSKPGHDPVALAISGALSRSGEDPERPSFPGIPAADLLTGSNAVIGVLAAVIARNASGRGQHVDIAMSDSAMALIGNLIARNPDLSAIPPRGQRRADSGIWKTRDGAYLTTTDMEPAYWARFCEAVGRPDFIPLQLDAAARPAIREALEAIFATRTLDEWLEILGAAETQFAPILDVAAALDDPHNRARGMVVELKTEAGETVRQLGSPVKLQGVHPAAARLAPPAGTDTEAVLAGLGFEAEALRAQGVLG